MHQSLHKKRAADYLYPPIEPFDQRMLDMGDGHHIYVEQCGVKNGIPVVVLHGGPGGGCSPFMRRYFDPNIYRVILFDQRGCGRSRPYASVENNTTWHLLRDIETIRVTLGLQDTIIFGGSWGAALALIYAITHPERVRHLVLRGVFLMTQAELNWFYAGGAGTFFPEHWARFMAPIPKDERTDIIAAYHRRLFGDDRAAQIRYARLWAGWENALASLHSNAVMNEPPGEYARAFSRLENHYFYNKGFLEGDNWILRNKAQIAHIPTSIVQGRYDMICPPISAYTLAEGWEKCQLEIVALAGHALSEADISAALIRIMDNIALNTA